MNKKVKNEKIGLKRIIKRNQVVILTLALMLMTAGYMNYTNNHENENTLLAQLGDAKLVSTNIVEENSIEVSEENNVSEENLNQIENNIVSEVVATNITQENLVETGINNLIENEVKETNANISDDYFTKSKLERDSMYSQMLETYTGILENEKIPSEQKKTAETEIKNINDTKNAIMIVENLLNTKEFNNAVVFINEESVNVVVKGDKIESEKVAQIQNIIQRELKKEIDNIHISTKK